MQFESQLNEEDWRAFNDEICRRGQSGGSFAFFLNFVTWLCIGLAFGALGSMKGWHAKSIYLGAAISFVVLFIMGQVERRKVMKRLMPREDRFFSRTLVSLDESGIRLSDSKSKSETNWQAFESLAVTENLLMLFSDRPVALLISMRNTDREELLAQVEKFSGLQAGLPQKKEGGLRRTFFREG